MIGASELQYTDGSGKISVNIPNSTKSGFALINIFGTSKFHVTHTVLSVSGKYINVGIEDISGTKPTQNVWTGGVLFYI